MIRARWFTRLRRNMRTLPGLLLLLSVLQVEESIGQEILRRIASGVKAKKGVMKVKRCGQPIINNVMRNLTLNLGETARFRCSVDMGCLVSYLHWYHEMNNGSMRPLITGGNPYGYTVRRVNPNDAGFYSCVVGNILGETVSSAYLEINSSPRAQVEAATTRNPPLASTTAPWVDMNLAVTSAGKVATSKIVNGTYSAAAPASVASFNFLLCFLVVGVV